jgi:hypothetical protein
MVFIITHEKKKIFILEKPNEEVQEYTRESRKEMYLKMAEEKELEDRRKNPEKYEPKKVSQMFKSDGEIRQCNEGKLISFPVDY